MAARSHPVTLAHRPAGHGHRSAHRADSAIEDHAIAMDLPLPPSSPARPASSSSSLSSTSSTVHAPASNITVTVRPPSPSLAERILIPDPSSATSAASVASSDADLLADLLHSKFSHMSLERPDAPSLMDVFGSGLDRVSIRHLLPTHGSLVKSALESTNLEYCTAIVTRVRKYLSMDRVPDAVDNVLKLGILPRLCSLLVFEDVPAPLKYEVCWVLTNVAAGSSAQTRELAGTPGLVASLVRLVGASDMNRDVRVQALWCLGNIVGDGDQLKALVVSEGGVEAAARFAGQRVINRDRHHHHDHEGQAEETEEEEEEEEEDGDLNPTARIVAWFASNVSRGIRSAGDWPAIQPLVPILQSLLTWPDTDTLVDAAWGLARVLQPIDHMHDIDPPPVSPATPAMAHQLVHLLSLSAHDHVSSSTSIRLRSPALRALTNLSTATDAWHIQLLVDAGAVPVLYELVRAGTPALASLPGWDGASPRAFSKDKVPGYLAKDAMLVLANMVACADLDVVRGVLEAAPVVKLWYDVLVAGLVPRAQCAAAAAPPAFSTRSSGLRASSTGGPAFLGVDVAIVREAAWAVSNLTTCREPLVMDYLTRHVDVGDDWRQVLIAGIGAGTAAPADVLGLGVQMGLLVPRAGTGAGGVGVPPPSVRRSAKAIAGTKKLATATTTGGINALGSVSSDEYALITAEVREKCADALLNMAIVLAPAGWLTHEHVANIDRIMAYVGKAEGGTRGRYAEVRELVMVGGNARDRGGFDEHDDMEPGQMTRGLEDVLGALGRFSMDAEQRAEAAAAAAATRGKGKLGPFGLLPEGGEGLAHYVAERGVNRGSGAGMVAAAPAHPRDHVADVDQYADALRRMSLMADQAV